MQTSFARTTLKLTGLVAAFAFVLPNGTVFAVGQQSVDQAQADGSRPAAQPSPFDRWDRDGDGRVSREDIPEPLRKNFPQVDTDKDGWITREEDQAFRNRNRTTRPQAARPVTLRPDVADKIVSKLNINYAGTDRKSQTLDLYLPKHRESDRPIPLLVWIHGGGWKSGSKDGAIGKLAPFVTSGRYAAASINYRLTDEGSWPIQIHDCKAAIRWLRATAKENGIDPERIAIWGSSAGGHLVAMLGTSGDVPEMDGKLGDYTDQSSRVTCVIDYYGPTNFLTMGDFPGSMDHNAPNSPEALLCGGPVQEKRDVVKSASPITYITKDDPPMLLVHGTKDPVVPIDQSVQLHAALQKAGLDSTLIQVEGAGHGQGIRADQQVRDFLECHLYGAKVKLESGTIPSAQKSPRAQ